MKHFKIIVLIMALLLIIPNSVYPSELGSPSITPTSLIQPLTAIHPTYPVYSTALSPSGRYLAIGSTKKVILWDVVRKMELQTLPIEGRDVISLCFSPDGKNLAVGSYKTIELWDMNTGNRITTFSGHNEYVTSLAFTPDGRSLASGSRGTDNSIILWDTTEKRLERRMTYQSQHADIVKSLSFSRDGSLLASVGTDKTINIWNLGKDASSLPTKIKPDLSESPVVISFSPDKRILSYGTSDGRIILHDIRKQKSPLQQEEITMPIPSPSRGGPGWGWGFLQINAHQGEIFSLSFSPDGNIITSTGRDKAIRRWNTETGKIIDARALNYDLQPAYISTNSSQIALFNTQGGAVFALTSIDAGVAGIPPVIVITSPVNQQVLDKPEVTLTGKIADDQGISEVRIEVNGIVLTKGYENGIILRQAQDDRQGVMVSLSNHDEQLGASASDKTRTRDLRIEGKSKSVTSSSHISKEALLNQIIHLNPGENRIVITAIDSDGLSKSETIAVNYAEEHGELWAAVIGISNYKHVEGLRYADKDAMAFYDYLVNDNKIPKDHVFLLTNEDATLTKVRGLLGNELKKKAGKEDAVIIFYAGHGAPEASKDSPDEDKIRKYLLPYDADPADLYSTALPMDEISTIFSRLSAERIVLLQDTCYSGGSLSGGRTLNIGGDKYRAIISNSFLSRITEGKGKIIITASDANEVSIERDDIGHGVFTYYLMEAFSKGDTDGDGFISVSEAYRYVSKKVPDATGQNQHPAKWGEERNKEIILGRTRK